MKSQESYYYADGSVYRENGKPICNMERGVFEFSNGTAYEGEWLMNLFNGYGYFIDATVHKW
jgi:hypothetical protein